MVVAISMVLCSCNVSYFDNNEEMNQSKETTEVSDTQKTNEESITDETIELDLNEFTMSSVLCKYLFDGMSPEEFCRKKGKGTLLYKGYTNVTVTDDDFLVLKLTDEELEEWKNSSKHMQILQKILGEEKQIVSEIVPPTDVAFGTLYEDADMDCGFEISEDYSKIIADAGDDQNYEAVVPYACIMMQVLSRKPSQDIYVEYTVFDSNGKISKYLSYPMYMFMFEDFNECKQLMNYGEIEAEVKVYDDPTTDKDYTDIVYKTFWGMSYMSEDLNYEIFAYEFDNRQSALKYSSIAAEDDEASCDEYGIYWIKMFTPNEYIIVVMENNFVYKIVSPKDSNYKIDKMLSSMFSQKIW